MMARALSAGVHAYRAVVSPWVGAACRLQPSCSAYALEALASQPVGRAMWLIAKRLGRCRPGGPLGADPVPSPSFSPARPASPA